MPSITYTFANGIEFTSSANNPESIATIFQAIFGAVFGFQPADTAQYKAVRVGWQTEGQPFNTTSENTCYLMFTPDNDPYSQVRDSVLAANDDVSVGSSIGYTQVWKMHATLYGPECQARAALLVSCIAGGPGLDWVHDALAAQNIYAVAEWGVPQYVPEERDGQWWRRCDVDLKFNELVIGTLTAPTVAGLSVELITNTGVSQEIPIP